MSSWRDKLTPPFLRPYTKIYREEGWRAVVKKGGWKLVGIVILYYLIRDSILYLLIPYLVARGIMSA
jgi:hypothetical protein